MMQFLNVNKYILIRNIVVACMIGNLLYHFFPFPPLLWRLTFVLFALYGAIKGIYAGKLFLLEKMILFFVGLNLLHFFFSYLWLDSPSTSFIGNVLYAMLALNLFSWLGTKQVLSERFFTVITCVFSVAGIVYFYHAQQMAIARLISDNAVDVTVNASGIFLVLIPFLFFIPNRLLSFVLLIIYWMFLFQGAKRGNILAALLPTVLYMYYILQSNKKSFFKILFLFIGVIIGGNLLINQVLENAYLLGRFEDTLEGNSSGRDVIYAAVWNTWYQSMDIFRYLFGFGFQGCFYQINCMAHNDWLEILVDYGLLGIMLYFSIFYSATRLFLKEKIVIYRLVLLSVVSIWALKSLYSMGFVEELTAFLFVPLGYCLVNYKSQVK